MKRRTLLVLTGMSLLGLAIAGLPHQPGFAQSDPFLGTWQMNLAKSKYSSGTAPRSATVNIQADGQNHKVITTGTGADGNPFSNTITLVFDGIAHPLTGNPNPNSDAVADTRIDAYTLIRSFTKAGKLVETVTYVVSPDGKTMTTPATGVNANGQPVNFIAVFDKQ
jgi:hypothetical protein